MEHSMMMMMMMMAILIFQICIDYKLIDMNYLNVNELNNGPMASVSEREKKFGVADARG